jgi:hypothetical protein
MSNSISTLLLRNLRDVFGESDPARRRAAIDELYNEDCVFYDPNRGAHRGRNEIDRIAGMIKATHPDFQYQPTTTPEELGDCGRVRWVSGSPGKAPAYAGTDFLIARNGKIAAVYLFFDGPGDATHPKGRAVVEEEHFRSGADVIPVRNNRTSTMLAFRDEVPP